MSSGRQGRRASFSADLKRGNGYNVAEVYANIG
jgi:hypothetical protein